MSSILYDGWPLIHQPNSPEAIHLMVLLAFHPVDIQAILALPGQPTHGFPEGIDVLTRESPNTAFARLMWEQRTLPGMAHDHGANLIHFTSENPPLFGPAMSVISPAGLGTNRWFTYSQVLANQDTGPTSLGSRLRDAFGRGGATRLRAVLWPKDLPAPETSVPVFNLPPVLHPSFRDHSTSQEGSNTGDGLQALHLPETFLLSHGPYSLPSLQRLVSAWSWAAGSIGENFPLFVLGLDTAARENLAMLSLELKLSEFVHSVPAISLETMAALYRKCTALFHPADISPWSGPVRFALAYGKPVVGPETPLAEALVGPAAYLVPGEVIETVKIRALGAALITVVVEESVSQALSQAALQRSAVWLSDQQGKDFQQALHEAYLSLLSLDSQ